MYADPSGHFAISTLIIGAIIGAAVGFGTSVLSQSLMGDKEINWGQVALDTVMGGISGALGASGSVAGDIIAVKGDLSELNFWEVAGKAVIMGGVGAILGKFTGAGTQNTKAMVDTINMGKSWGSKAFLTSAKEALLRPNSGLTLQTMYMNMAKAISLYTIQGITKVSAAVFGSTFLGNSIGW